MIWDVHCHLGGLSGRTPHERMSRLIELADRMGIERLCVSMGMNWSYDPDPASLRRQNDEVLEALSHWHHRAFGFVYLNPNHVKESLKELERCVRDGPMVGVKLWVACRCNDPRLDEIVARAAELDAPVLQHTWIKTPAIQNPGAVIPRASSGNLPGESTPQDLAELAGRHPGAKLICGHTGGNWELGIRAVRAHANVFLDLAGSDPTQGLTEMAVREVGADRVLFGSDAPGRSFASQLAKVWDAGIPDAAKRQILKGNLARILTPALSRKGMKP